MNTIAALVLLQLATQPATALERASQSAELFWDQFTAVQSVERVTQTKLKDDGKAASSKTTEFDYVALLKPRASGVAVEESRVPRSNVAPERPDPLLVTSGFPAFLLLFHPDFRNKFDFQESADSSAPAGTVRLAFKSKPGERSMSAVRLKARLYPILWQGYAWIDERTGDVQKIVASLESSMDDLGLSELRAEIEYKPVTLRNSSLAYNLPSRVTVSAATPKRRWRTVQEFSGYKLFTVTTSTRGESGKP